MITSLDQLHTAWVDDDGGGDLIAIIENQGGQEGRHRPVLGLAPLDALALAGQLIGLARDALQAQEAVPALSVQRVSEPADLGPILRQARHDAGVSAASLAGTLGSAGPTITSIELGNRHPRLPMLLRILDALGMRLAVIPK